MPSPQKIAIIMVHYEDYALKHFKDCHDSLQRQTQKIPDGSLFIVANGASKEAERFVKSIAPDAHHLYSATNTGWSVANNMGIRQALAAGFEWIILLNMDVSLDQDWLLHLADAAQKNQDVRIFQSKILLHGTNKINSIGNHIHFLGYGYCDGYGRPDGLVEPYRNIAFASGASMLIHRGVFDTVGLLEDKYFLYYDDLEFCWRARLAGFEIALASDSVCYHKHAYKDKLAFLFHLEYNRLLTMMTLMNWKTLLLLLVPLTISQILSGIYFTLRGRFVSVVKIYLELAKPETWRFIRQKRALIKTLRKRKDGEIVQKFSKQLVFAESNHPLIECIANPLLGIYWAAARRFIQW